jgi:hypothetical protein
MVYVYTYMSLRTYEVLEFEENKLDKMSVKKTHDILNIYIDVIVCIKIYI